MSTLLVCDAIEEADGHKGRGAMGSALLIFGEHLVEPVIRADLGWMAVSL